jgi:hypothetical protein
MALFDRKKSGVIVVTLNARLQPTHRADLEDAFESYCSKGTLRAEVVGGGTSIEPSTGEVTECDIEIELADVSDENLAEVRGVFEVMLAPKGSRITVPGRADPIEFGWHEALALYLNGTDLAAEVYEQCDSGVVLDEVTRLLGADGAIHSWWQGPTETALYAYGPSFDAMRLAIQPFVDTYPLCERSRLVRIA